MERYIGFKMVEAEPMTDIEFNVFKKGAVTEDFAGIETQGYKIIYPDGYISWSPKDVFNKDYMQVGSEGKVEESNVHDFVKNIEYMKWGEKTTIANATLVNGFVITESSSCVDPANYNQDIGESICRERIYNEVWKMLGFLLQSAKYGIK